MDKKLKESIYGCVGKGWRGILDKLIDDLEKMGWNGEVLQVKEKFGGLRFYISYGTKEIQDRIYKAEEESFKTCENCGKPGKLTGTYWIKTLCKECDELHNNH